MFRNRIIKQILLVLFKNVLSLFESNLIMQELFETVDRKFIESYEINDFEILTDSGWIDADAIHKTVEYKIWKLSTPSYTLKCADNHIVFKKNFE